MFTDQTIGTPTSWSWTFEGGTPETFDGQTPTYITYSEAGDWDVTLIVSDGVNEDSLTLVEYIHTGLPPMADFVADETEVTAGTYTNFTSLSTGDDLSYEWYFEGGTPETSTDENPNEIYYLIMEWEWYDVTLIAVNPYGSDTLTKEDYIEVVPENVNEIGLTDHNVKLYPNPNKGVFNLTIPSGIEADVEIMDLRGVYVYQQKVFGTETIELAGLNQGIYLMRILDEKSGNLIFKRLIIQ